MKQIPVRPRVGMTAVLNLINRSVADVANIFPIVVFAGLKICQHNLQILIVNGRSLKAGWTFDRASHLVPGSRIADDKAKV